MHRIFTVTFTGAMLAFSSTILQAATAVQIDYGVVTSVGSTSKEAKHAGGALAGGLIGGMVGPDRHRGLRVITGAGIGAAIQGSATSGVLQQYSVRLNSGSEVVISTEQRDIRSGDCVTVEQGEHANIRRVSSYHCETGNKATEQHHQAAADNCQLAKNELNAADTDEAITLAAKKVRVLCED